MKIQFLFRRLIAATCLMCSLVYAREPEYINEALNPAKVQGSGKLTWWGLHVYDATLYLSLIHI